MVSFCFAFRTHILLNQYSHFDLQKYIPLSNISQTKRMTNLASFSFLTNKRYKYVTDLNFAVPKNVHMLLV